jgi:cytochrome c-type biogenesis protein CcmH
MAMTPEHRLSLAREVVVEARVSEKGNATPSPGDLEGRSPAVAPGTRGIVVTIDRVLP